VRVLGNHRHRGVQQVREQEVVEADQGHLVLAAHPAQGKERADRHEVLCGEQRSRRPVAAEERGGRDVGGLDGRHVVHRRPRCDRQPRRSHRLDVAGMSLLCGGDAGQVAEEPDVAVPGGDQVGDPVPGAELVVGEHHVGVEASGGAVDEHHRCPGATLGHQVGVIDACRHDDQSVDPA